MAKTAVSDGTTSGSGGGAREPERLTISHIPRAEKVSLVVRHQAAGLERWGEARRCIGGRVFNHTQQYTATHTMRYIRGRPTNALPPVDARRDPGE